MSHPSTSWGDWSTASRAMLLRNLVVVIMAVAVLIPSVAIGSSATSGHGILRVSTGPIAGAEVLVDGTLRDTGGLEGLELGVGSHSLCFGTVPDHVTPPCQTVEIKEGKLTTIVGDYAPAGTLSIRTNPDLDVPVTVDGVVRDEAPADLIVAVGPHEVCFGERTGYSAPACQTIDVAWSRTDTVTGEYVRKAGGSKPTQVPTPMATEPTPDPTPTDPSPTTHSSPTEAPGQPQSPAPPLVNLLSANQQDFESGKNGWIPQGNVVLDGRGTPPSTGQRALGITVSRSGYTDNSGTARTGTEDGTDGVPVTPGTSYAAWFDIRPGSAPSVSDVRCEIRWYRSDGGILGTDKGTLLAESVDAFVTPSCRATAPGKAAYAGVRVFIDGADYGDVHVLDNAWFVVDAGVAVSPPPVEESAPTPVPAPTPEPSTTPEPSPTADPRPSGTWPTERTSGVPAGTSLSTHHGDLSIKQDGAVIDSLHVVDGIVHVYADNVTIRRTLIDCRPGAPFCLRVHGNSGTVIEDVEVDGQGNVGDGIHSGVGVTIRRSRIHAVGDGIKLGPGGTYIDNYIHDLRTDGAKHPDAMQATGPVSNVAIRNNRLEGRWRDHTSAIILKADLGAIDGVLVEGNLLSGGSYTFYAYDGSSHDLRNVTVRDNTFVRDSARFGSCAVRAPEPGFVWEGNRFSDGQGFPRTACTEGAR